jgi:hypothetical protein
MVAGGGSTSVPSASVGTPSSSTPTARTIAAPVHAAAIVKKSEPIKRAPERVVLREQIRELDIPTFIRRQMD